MKAGLPLLAGALLLPSVVQAQGDPWNPPVGGDRDDRDHDHGTRPIYAGDFVLIPQGADFLLLDSKTGCVWRRSPSSSGFGSAIWEHEFPDYSRLECNKRLELARKNALKEGGN